MLNNQRIRIKNYMVIKVERNLEKKCINLENQTLNLYDIMELEGREFFNFSIN